MTSKGARTVRLERIHGRKVRDAEGRVAGRILSVRAERQGDACVVKEFDLGAAALLQRLGIGLSILVGLPFRRQPLRVAWQEMDLTDPERPRLTITIEEARRGGR